MSVSNELHLIDRQLESIDSLKITETITSLNLHHNLITHIQGLEKAINLRLLDLSSNIITNIYGLDALSQLRTLNLSSNRLTRVDGLGKLISLISLDLSFNAISDLNGLKELHTSAHRLSVLNLQGNNLFSLPHLLECVGGLSGLRYLNLFDSKVEQNNPVCYIKGYRRSILSSMLHLEILDNVDRQSCHARIPVLADAPELPGRMDVIENRISDRKTTQIENSLKNDELQQLQPSVLVKSPASSGSEYTERRLANLESQLSSLVALQLLRMQAVQPSESQVATPSPAAVASPILQSEEGESDNLATWELQTGKPGKSQPLFRQASEEGGSKEKGTPGGTVSRKPLDRELSASGSGAGRGNARQEKQDQMKRPVSEPPPKNTRSDSKSGDTSVEKASNRQTIKGPAHAAASGKGSTEPLVGKTSRSVSEEHHPGAPKKRISPSSNSASNHGTASNPEHARGRRRETSGVDECVRPVTPAPPCDLVGTTQKHSCRRSAVTQQGRDSSETRVQKAAASKMMENMLKELASEQGQRKKAEQLCLTLSKRVANLEVAAVDEEQVLLATQKLKDAFTSERRLRLSTESKLRALTDEFSKLSKEVEATRLVLTTEKKRFTEELSRMCDRFSTADQECRAALSRAEAAEKQLTEVKQLLTASQAENRKCSASQCDLNGPEMTRLINSRLESAEALHQQALKSQQEKLKESEKKYQDLEDEFRMALRIEADRYNQLFESADVSQQKLMDAENVINCLTERGETAGRLITDLTSAMKEQKSKALSQQKTSLLLQHNQKERISELEEKLKEARSKAISGERLRKELKQLKADMIAKDSLIDGLRAEKRHWGEELAQQGSALAQDRGRLEAKVETLEGEVNSLRKNLDETTDTVKIKQKIIEDQTNTIQTVKQNLGNSESQLKRLQETSKSAEKRLEDQLTQIRRENEENQEKVQKLAARKLDLKETISNLECQIGELQGKNNALNQRWRDRTSLLDKLEKQVEEMRRGWDEQQQALVEERDMAKQQVQELQSELNRIEADFHNTLANALADQQQTTEAAQKEAEQVRATCEGRVAEVEAEMRAVLLESEEARRLMESRLRKLSAVLCETTPDSSYPSSHSRRAVASPHHVTAQPCPGGKPGCGGATQVPLLTAAHCQTKAGGPAPLQLLLPEESQPGEAYLGDCHSNHGRMRGPGPRA